jgi:hypothetical protein
MTHQEWLDEGTRRFGPDIFCWRFGCPVCGHVASIEDFRQFKDQGATPDSATCECLSRYLPDSPKAFGENPTGAKRQPCDYAGYGLFRLSPIVVIFPDGSEHHAFEFGPERTA